MRKQIGAQRRKRRMANANYRLSESVQTSITGLFDSIDGGEDVAVTYLRKEFLTKFCDESHTPAAQRRNAAIQRFRDCEQVNAATNLWWKERDEDFNILPRITLRRFLRFARQLIRDVLGPLKDEIVLGTFSGGASTSRRRTESIPAQKFNGKADITEGAMVVLPVLHRLAPLLPQYVSLTDVNTVRGSVLFTVPKKSDIDRCACKEPDVNMFLQKGVGAYIKRRLLRFGQNLSDQSINRSLALCGSRDNSLATIDLSSASDLISTEVVRALLPPLWFEYLDSIRSHEVAIDDETLSLEMFSSMGNGFTFELESLIFFALTRSVAYFEGISGIISIYGDDIIAPSSCYDSLVFVLGKFGFTVNESKSFHTGPFRESCGGHYSNGIDITPFYLKRRATRLTDVIRVANQLRRWAFADPWRRYEHDWVYPLWVKLKRLVPKDLWGGYDLSLDTQLVSPDIPRNRLSRLGDNIEAPDVGLYLEWHNQNWDRTAPPLGEASKPISTNQFCRRRRAKPGNSGCRDYFYEEIVFQTEST